MNLYAIFGAGGFGREVMPYARKMLDLSHKQDEYKLVFVVEDGYERPSDVNGYDVLSVADFLSHDVESKYFNIAIRNWKARKRIAEDMVSNQIKPFSIEDPSVIINDNNRIGEGAILCPFTTITSNIKIGKFFHLNIYSYVAHDCQVGDFVTFAPNVHCNGWVVVEDYAYIGAGAIIKDGTDKPIIIGEGAIVGMGAVVTESVSPYKTVFGNPAVEFKK